MDTIESIIKFLSSYPAWAKLLVMGNVVCAIATLIFATRSSEAGDMEQPSGANVLKIKRVELFPDSDLAEVQVSAFVNGTEFRYPSLAGVEWLKVASSMAGQSFKLPNAEQYELRFEMRKREKPGGPIASLVSQETVALKKAPFASSYALHGFDPASRTRSGTVSAQIVFSFETPP
jgi:hypothetical protein